MISYVKNKKYSQQDQKGIFYHSNWQENDNWTEEAQQWKEQKAWQSAAARSKLYCNLRHRI